MCIAAVSRADASSAHVAQATMSCKNRYYRSTQKEPLHAHAASTVPVKPVANAEPLREVDHCWHLQHIIWGF